MLARRAAYMSTVGTQLQLAGASYVVNDFYSPRSCGRPARAGARYVDRVAGGDRPG